MREKPILFSSEMVRAILDGRKSVTRRVIKPQPEFFEPLGRYGAPFPYRWGPEHPDLRCKIKLPINCPYGNMPGSPGMDAPRLWVRETWCPVHDEQFGAPDWIDYRATPRYSAEHPAGWDAAPKDAESLKWRPSIFMPRWASRLTLEVSSVRVERLQEISEDDARAEGVAPAWLDVNGRDVNARMRPTYRQGFARLWGEINGKRPGCAWADNCWVWIISFRKIEDAQ